MAQLTNNKPTLHISTYSGWYRFEQSNGEWVETEKALTFWKLTSLQVDPNDAHRVYVATEHSGLFITQDGGAKWQRAKPNVPRLTTNALLALPGSVLAGTWPAALYRANNGADWRELEGVRLGASGGNFPPSPELEARVRFLAASHETPQRLFAAIEVGGILVSDDNGEHWSQISGGLDDSDPHQILASKRHKGVVIAVCGEGIYRSADGGDHWEKITPAGARDFGSSVAEDSAGAIYVAVALGRPNTWLREERADAAVFVSTDAGVHWRVVIETVRGGIMAMCPAHEDGVFASTSEGEVLHLGAAGTRKIVTGLPSITALAVGL